LPDNEGLTSIKVDLDYLEKLEIILRNKFFNPIFMYFGSIEKKIDKLLKKYKVKTFEMKLGSRGGNLEEYRCDKIKKGKCYCVGSKFIKHNIVIPNGNVLICSADYGMRHILGNLNNQSYESLFEGKEYYKLLKAMKNGGKNILCENCEGCINVYSMDNLIRQTKKILGRIKNGS
jgi:radical SAM protein with 4Fe4S-binding SPASM domain